MSLFSRRHVARLRRCTTYQPQRINYEVQSSDQLHDIEIFNGLGIIGDVNEAGRNSLDHPTNLV